MNHEPSTANYQLKMRAMIFEKPGQLLRAADVSKPKPGTNEVLIQVRACAVCRTDLHVVDGELPKPKLPLVPGHEVVGVIVEKGRGVQRLKIGDRVGIPWLGWTCGECEFCRSERENLCDRARFTGYTLDGGYAEFTVADERFCFPIPDVYSDVEAAPLLCAGLIGYRSLIKTGDAQRLGIYGFGAAAHIIAQVAKYQRREIFAFTRHGDSEAQSFAKSLGAVWAGDSETTPPQQLDAAIVFAPVGELVPLALKAVARGGTVVCGGIHMSDIPSFPYDLLWEERSVCSVANLTRRDGEEFFALAPKIPVRTTVQTFPLAEANEALSRLRSGELQGAAVLVP
ncbi:MAG TPA: zinc-dependent alcohol dehydrogenase family protein [Candidatus Sulfopaludibacter sp.]|nr:zinc-dependent alcohol dehydrogenase family protein [Candidatus Sulfopaludibacter sp.]